MVNLIILGIDHRLQPRDLMLKQKISELCKGFQVTLIAEEFRPGEVSVAGEAAEECGIAPPLQVDMEADERERAGIAGVLSRYEVPRSYSYDVTLAEKPWPPPKRPYLKKADGIREEYWLRKIEAATNNTRTLLVCGSMHVDFVAKKAEARGHSVMAKGFFPEELQLPKFETVDE